ncbi:hypothetical protein CY35_02G068100 [Sphagnum magellanicum]|nr:hypothetical protein CY35_02G068100 [Sphagnum magellanicum]KAH9570957.1 hypothetical protein CY35_02G068100 [Sphagnum magellanicum]KAH9570958.1 hypothetical protein CY35_02G068100 [Sphagnum magellanicum]
MSEGWNNANCGDSSGTNMASVKQEEADGLGPQGAVMKNANENETSRVNPPLQSWPFSVDIRQPVTTNSGFTQQLSLAGTAGSDQPYLLVNQSDASQGPAFGHQQRGKSVAVNAGTGGVENWVSERWEEPIEPQDLSESHQQERFNLQGSSKEMGTGTGSSGLEQMSGTGTLATSVGMGGSVGLGLSGSLGQEAGGGRSVSGRSSGLSEVDGVAPGFWRGRGGSHGVRGPNQGHGAGTVFSKGMGSGQVFNLWGMNPTGFPRAQAVAMAGAGTFAAAGRGNLAYALNPAKPVQGISQGLGKVKDDWKVDKHQQEDSSRVERSREGVSAVHTIEQQQCEYSQVPIPMGLPREYGNEIEQRVEPDRPIDSGLQQEISVVGPCAANLESHEACCDMIAAGSTQMALDFRGSQDSQAYIGKNDAWCSMPKAPNLRNSVLLGPLAVASSPPVAIDSPSNLGPESLPLEPGTPKSCKNGLVTSGGLKEGWSLPNLGRGKSTLVEAQPDQPLVLDLVAKDCSPLVKGHPLLEGDKVSDLGLSMAVGNHKVDCKALEDGRMLCSNTGKSQEPANGDFGSTSKQGDWIEMTTQAHSSGKLFMPHIIDTADKVIAEASKPMVASAEAQDLRKEFLVSRRMQESMDERKKLDHSEVKYWNMLAGDGEINWVQEKERRALIKVKRERDSNDKGEEDSAQTLHKKQKANNLLNNVQQITIRIPDTAKLGFTPPPVGAGSFLQWAIGIGKGRAGNDLREVSISPSVLEHVTPRTLPSPGPVVGASNLKITKFLKDLPRTKSSDKTNLEIKKGKSPLQEVQGLSGFNVNLVTKEGPGVEIRETYDEVLQASASQKLTDLDGSSLADHAALSALRPSKFGSFFQQGTKSLVPENVVNQQRRVATGKKKVDDTCFPLWTARQTEEGKLLSVSAGANPLISTADCREQLQPQQISSSKAKPSLAGEAPAKGNDGLAGTQQHVPNHASKGAQDSLSARVTTYDSSKNAHDMWIHRFSPKAVVRPAICEVPQPAPIRPSSSKQALPPNHTSQAHSKGHKFTEQECSLIPQTESHSDDDIQIKAPQNNAGKSSGPHVQSNLSAAGGLPLGTLVSSFQHGSVHACDGSGDFPNEQITRDYAALMSAVKTWRIETAKYREDMIQSSSSNRAGVQRCWFCGLPGHCVVDCSETLDCELRELEKRVVNNVEIWLSGEVLCLRCLGIGHWGAQCYLSVTEAASRAHDKAEFWKLNKTQWIGNSREQVERRMETASESRDMCDYTNRDTAGVVCYNCNQMGHWARYCPKRRSSSGCGGQSSGSGKGHQSSNSSGGKFQASRNQGKMKAYAHTPSSDKPAQDETQTRHVQQPETDTAVPLKLEKYLSWESQLQPDQERCVRSKPEEIISEVKEHEEKNRSQRRNPAVISTEAMHLQVQRRPQLDGVTSSNKVEGSRSGNELPPVPNGMLTTLELIRLSRPDLQKWVDSPDLGARVKGFFLRLRLGRWEAQRGGTGYRMARIKGAVKKSAVGQTMVISVDLGASECNVDGQYVSNQAFKEVELAEWWREAWMKGKTVGLESEIHLMLSERQRWPVSL